MTITNVSRHCQMSPAVGGTVASGENYSVQLGESVSRRWCKPLDSLRCSEGQCGVRAEEAHCVCAPAPMGHNQQRPPDSTRRRLWEGKRDKPQRRQIRCGLLPHLPLCSPAVSCHSFCLDSVAREGLQSVMGQWLKPLMSLLLSPKTGTCSGACRDSCGDYMCLPPAQSFRPGFYLKV